MAEPQLARDRIPFSDPDYKEGFGKNATGGAGKTTYIVTSSTTTGSGSFYQAFQPGDFVSNKHIVFAVPTFTIPTTSWGLRIARRWISNASTPSTPAHRRVAVTVVGVRAADTPAIMVCRCRGRVRR